MLLTKPLDGVAAERQKEDSIADAGGILKALN